MEDNKLCLEKQPLNQEMLDKIDAYWRAANYLSGVQLTICLPDSSIFSTIRF